jgi:CheY-like chemotaxis protein
MPEMDGYTAARCIRERETTAGGHATIVAMTANAMREDRARCLEAGMDGFIPKPIAMEELETALDHWISRAPGARPPAVVEHTGTFSVDASLAAALAAQFAPESESLDQTSVDLSVLESLSAALDSDDEFVARLIVTYVTDTESRIALLRDAVDEHDALAAEQLGHAIKGASGNVGATCMASLGGDIQQAGRSGDLERVANLVHRIAAEFVPTRAILEDAYPMQTAVH